MSNDKKSVISIIALALFCSSLPMITLIVMGGRGQNGTLWDQIPQQLSQPAMFVSMTLAKLVNGALLIPIIGLALSFYYRHRNRKKFQWTSISFALFLAGTILFAVWSTWMEINYSQQALSAEQRAGGYSSVNCISTFVNIISWTILLFAVFSPKFNANNGHTEIK